MKISAVQARPQSVLTILVGLALVSVPLFALVWGGRWIFRRMRSVPMLHLRARPLCAAYWLMREWEPCPDTSSCCLSSSTPRSPNGPSSSRRPISTSR